MIFLCEINEENFRDTFKLKVSEEQKHFVAPAEFMLSRAYVYRETAEPLVIYNDNEMIGYLLIREYEDNYCIDQFMIDKRYQGKGYGKKAMKLVLEKLRKERKYEKISLCYCEGDDAARNLYEGLGFNHTGEADEDEIIMELVL